MVLSKRYAHPYVRVQCEGILLRKKTKGRQTRFEAEYENYDNKRNYETRVNLHHTYRL